MRGHFPALDGVRGLAILLVLAHNLDLMETYRGLIGHWLKWNMDIGWVGVQLFFVLSGFLITHGLIANRTAPDYYQTFYMRRVLRIFPLYYAVLLFTFGVLAVVNLQPPLVAADAPNQIWFWLYLSNWTGPAGICGPSLPHFWSLAVEEQFYLVWPLVVRHATSRQLLRFCGVVFAASFALRWGMVAIGTNPEAIYESSLSRMDALAIGAAAAAAFSMPTVAAQLSLRRNRILVASLLLGLVGLVATRGYPRVLPIGQTMGYSVLALVFAGLIVAAVAADNAGAGGWAAYLRLRPLRALGKYSYAMYIFHKPLHDWIAFPLLKASAIRYIDSPWVSLAYVMIVGTICFGMAVLSYHLFEKHFLKLKDRFPAGGVHQLS
jgi:peptidoglycan/LPS O-acetylase OafA/YrhL